MQEAVGARACLFGREGDLLLHMHRQAHRARELPRQVLLIQRHRLLRQPRSGLSPVTPLASFWATAENRIVWLLVGRAEQREARQGQLWRPH